MAASSPLDLTALTEAVVPVAAQFTLQEDGNVVMTPSSSVILSQGNLKRTVNFLHFF